ncbi:hypothetical protein JCM8208_002400 [Rhodotorula glutinis]
MASMDHLSSPLAHLDLSSPVAEQAPFPLLALPEELLEIILEHAYAARVPRDGPHAPYEYGLKLAHKPVCRRLWAIQQRVLYRRIEVLSFDQLVDLERALVRDRRLDEPRLGRLVRALVVGGDPLEAWHGPGGTDDGAGPGVPGLAARLLSQLFGELGQLQSLEVNLLGDPTAPSSPAERALLAVLVEDPTTPVKLSGLKSLVILTNGKSVVEGPGSEVDDVAAWMDQFGRFPDLVHLDIYLGSKQPPSVAHGESQPPLALIKLSRLLVETDFARWVTPLSAIAPNLLDLEISATSYSLRPVILGAPPSLLRLLISSRGDPVESVDDLLPSLSLLKNLSLHITCYEMGRLSSSLSQLRHLEHLEFGGLAEVSTALLLALVDGRTRLKHLRSLEICTVFALRGPSLLRKKLVLPDESERDGAGLWHGWLAPRWPAGLSEAGLAQVVDVARTRGVRVRGGSLGSLGWRAKFERERDVVAVCRGVSTGDWSYARRYLEDGDERVDAFLARQRREGRRRSLGRELSLL